MSYKRNVQNLGIEAGRVVFYARFTLLSREYPGRLDQMRRVSLSFSLFLVERPLELARRPTLFRNRKFITT